MKRKIRSANERPDGIRMKFTRIGRATRFTRGTRRERYDLRVTRKEKEERIQIQFLWLSFNFTLEITILRSLSIYGFRYRDVPFETTCWLVFRIISIAFSLKLSLCNTKCTRTRIALASRNLFSNNVIALFVEFCQTLAESKNA